VATAVLVLTVDEANITRDQVICLVNFEEEFSSYNTKEYLRM